MDVRELLSRDLTPELYREVRELWKAHSIAEDKRDIAGLIATLTPDCVYEVVGEASDGVEVVEKFRKLRPDLVMMDIVMPKRSGIDAVRAIKSQDAAATIVMCSALGQETLVMEAIQARRSAMSWTEKRSGKRSMTRPR